MFLLHTKDSYKKVALSFVWIFVALICTTVPTSAIAALLALLTIIVVGAWVQPTSSIHMMYFLGYGTFLYLPSLLNWWYLETPFVLFYISSFASILFLIFTKDLLFKANYNPVNSSLYFFGLLSFLFVTLSVIGAGSFMRPFFPFLIILMALSFEQGQIKRNISLFCFFTIVFLVFVLTSWSGFGRVVVMGWIILAMLLTAYSLNFKVNKYLLSLIPGLGATLISGRDILNLEFNGFEAALRDSAYGPYRTATSFIDRFNEQGADLSGFFDQVIFTLFIFVPRDIWTTKPFGFGFEYTVRHLDFSLVDAGHSIASTLIGDHIYYLGYFGVITGIIALYAIAILCRLLYGLRGLNGNGVLLLSASMMVLVWGGMTSFSARVAMPAIIFTLLYFSLHRLLTKKITIGNLK